MSRRKIAIKDKLPAELHDIHDLLVTRHDGSNVGRALFDIYYWQLVCETAKRELDHAWALAQAEDGIIKEDDVLRLLGKGEHIVAESERFSCLVTVQDPRLTFDRESFLERLCRVFSLERSDVDKLADACKAPTKVPLSKRVVEAS